MREPNRGLKNPLIYVVGAWLGFWLFYAHAEQPPAPSPQPPAPDSNELAWSQWLAAELESDAEHVLFSGKRVDVLTSRLAIEVEWCDRKKVSEAVEQATFYGVATGRPGAIVLLTGRGDHRVERVTYNLVVEAAARAGVRAVSIIDVRDPDLGACCEHLGLVPTTYRGHVKD